MWRVTLTLLGAAALSAQAAGQNPHRSDADAAEGRQYYLGHCAHCHGPDGEGGRGPSLAAGRYRRGDSDGDLYRNIRFGVPGTEMPGARLIESDVWKVVTHVRRLATAGAEEKPAGDARAGQQVYQSKGACSACHVVGRAGRALGPDLSDIGLRRTAKFLRESLTDPARFIADSYHGVTVVTAAGSSLTGVRLNEDDYSIQIRDTQENLRSFLKRDLKQLRRETTSLMPAYGAILSARELDDLVAYLSSLRGKP